jgi:putative ABC transport system permease protein
MFKNYIKIAFRNLTKQKLLSMINILGLSIGIACFSLFILYAVNEFSYDGFHKNADRTFRVNQWYTSPDGGEGGTSETPVALGPSMKREFSDVEQMVRIKSSGSSLIHAGDKSSWMHLNFADPQIFSVFSFPLLYGNPATVLADSRNMVITREKALQLFGKTNVVGKRIDIKYDDQIEPFLISGVVENLPENSTISFDLLGNFGFIEASKMGQEASKNWNMTIGLESYVMLRKGSQLMEQPIRLKKFRQQYMPDEAKQNGGNTSAFVLQPLKKMHTSVNLDAGPPGSTTDPKNIWLLVCISAIVLVIASINFTTLAIGRSAGRAKEVGLRKVIGGRRKQLIYQFLTESMLLALLSAVLGICIAQLLLPYFNQLSGRTLSFSFQQYPQLVLYLSVVILLVGLSAGSYPALVLSGFRPAEVLKSKIKLGGSNFFTKSLVTFQFIFSIGLMVATFIILQQLSYMRSKNLGFDKENVVVVNTRGLDTKKIYPLFKQAVQAQEDVLNVASSVIGLGEGQGQMGGGYHLNGKNAFALEYPIDRDYLKVMGMQLIAGRNFDASFASDTLNAAIVNETLVRTEMNSTPEKVLKQQFNDKANPGEASKMIIGVVKDFNFEPLTKAVRPQIFTVFGNSQNAEQFLVRIRPGNPALALSKIESSWRSLVPDLPFTFSFLDDNMNRFYLSEQRWGRIMGWAGGISIFLACMGLFGLASLTVANRTKEIGIRKVLGASSSKIISLLSKGFLNLVVIAFLIASPVAWFFTNKWLQNYAFRINIEWWVFLVTGVSVICVTLLTVGFQAVKAAMSNPVESLRTE